MANKRVTTKTPRYKVMPGTIIECKSGRYLAFYEHRIDIVANGDNEREAKKMLKEMYKAVLEYEKNEEEITDARGLPKDFKTKGFTEKLLIN